MEILTFENTGAHGENQNFFDELYMVPYLRSRQAVWDYGELFASAKLLGNELQEFTTNCFV